MFERLSVWYKGQSSTTKCFLWMIPILILGIILRWDYIIEGLTKGFSFFNINK